MFNKHSELLGISIHYWLLLLCCTALLQSSASGRTLLDYVANRKNRTSTTAPTTTTPKQTNRDITIGPCTWAIQRTCPDEDVKFYLYTRRNVMDRQCLHIDETLDKSNITESNFNAKHPTKIIIHGYNSDMFLHPLQLMRDEYLAKSNYNLIYVDWSVLSPGPCYISAVHNTKHAGACVAQLVERILDLGSTDIHVIGFSLGAQLPNYIARNLGSFMLPRITGLDPAMPLFMTASTSDKLDPSDAVYVDVIHTNALVQGKLERCGHADFYMNGGIMQPGCSVVGTNPFACSHQRAPAYFLESIRSHKGFWGWACSSYISYLLGMCPPTNYLLEAGENIRTTTRGMFMINTNDTTPYALGKWTDLPTLGVKQQPYPLKPVRQAGDPLLQQIDTWGKLASNYNNLEYLDATPSFSQDSYSDNWTYFSSASNADVVTSTVKDADSADSVEEQENSSDYIRLSKSSTVVVDDEAVTTAALTTTPQFEWFEYRRNLTEGFIDNNIFQVPRIVGRR